MAIFCQTVGLKTGLDGSGQPSGFIWTKLPNRRFSTHFGPNLMFLAPTGTLVSQDLGLAWLWTSPIAAGKPDPLSETSTSVLSQQQTSFPSQQQTSVLPQQQTSVLSQMLKNIGFHCLFLFPGIVWCSIHTPRGRRRQQEPFARALGKKQGSTQVY